MKYDIEKMLSEIKTLPRRYNLSYVQLQSCKENPEPQDAFENVAGRNGWTPETRLDFDYKYKIFDIPYINSILRLTTCTLLDFIFNHSTKCFFESV
mgnify:CR=1 FL=1